MGTLYIIATPIGNLQDLSYRAVESLTRVEIIACEDTRHTGLLLKYIRDNNLISTFRHSGEERSDDSRISTQGDSGRANSSLARMTAFEASSRPTLLSYYDQNEFKRIPQILNALKNGIDVALVSDAGTPTISDPGFKLVRESIKQGVKIESIPGQSSVISSLVVSGLPTDKFLFLGYPPKRDGHRKKLFRSLTIIQRSIKVTYILFEAPHRLLKTLEELQEVLGNIDIVITRELTKIHEEIRREKISESIEHFRKVAPRGEFVVLFHLEN